MVGLPCNRIIIITVQFSFPGSLGLLLGQLFISYAFSDILLAKWHVRKGFHGITSLSCGIIMCLISKLWRKFWVEKLLSPRGPRLVRPLLRGHLAFIGIMSPLQTLLALHIGGC